MKDLTIEFPAEKYDKFQKLWTEWITRHPLIQEYLDPPMCLLEQVAVPALSPQATVIGALPANYFPIAPISYPDANGNAWTSLYQCATMGQARTLGVAFRTHFADSAGNGGLGPQVRVLCFTTTAGGLHEY
jgi:hypothetical protein